jgi:hypothetical protein
MKVNSKYYFNQKAEFGHKSQVPSKNSLLNDIKVFIYLKKN